MQVTCPTCNTLLDIPDHLVGKLVKCPCGETLKAKGSSSVSPSQSRIQIPTRDAKQNMPSPKSELSPLAQSIANSGAEVRKSQDAALRERQEKKSKKFAFYSRKNDKPEEEAVLRGKRQLNTPGEQEAEKEENWKKLMKGYEDEGWFSWRAIVKLSLALGLFAAIVGGMLWFDKAENRALMSEELRTWVAGFLCSSPFILLFSWFLYSIYREEKEEKEPLVKCFYCDHLVANDGRAKRCPNCGGVNA